MSSAALFCRDLGRSLRNHGHEGATLEARLDRDTAAAKGVKRMVLAHADAFARIEFGAALAHDHVAAFDLFAAEQFDAQALAGRVTTVARRTACFFVCHTTKSLNSTGGDLEHFQLGEVLAMTALAMGVLAALFLEGD